MTINGHGARNVGISVLGIDPGKYGGLALVRRERIDGIVKKAELVHAAPMPNHIDKSKSFCGNYYPDFAMILEFMQLAIRTEAVHADNNRYELAMSIIIEKQQAMPKQGSSSTFKNGFYFGALVGCVAPVVGIENLFTVRGFQWKGHLGLSANKEESRTFATSLFDSDQHWKRKKDEGVAEAALIAYYRLRRLWKINVETAD